jgi:hypothetical protein
MQAEKMTGRQTGILTGRQADRQAGRHNRQARQAGMTGITDGKTKREMFRTTYTDNLRKLFNRRKEFECAIGNQSCFKIC